MSDASEGLSPLGCKTLLAFAFTTEKQSGMNTGMPESSSSDVERNSLSIGGSASDDGERSAVNRVLDMTKEEQGQDDRGEDTESIVPGERKIQRRGTELFAESVIYSNLQKVPIFFNGSRDQTNEYSDEGQCREKNSHKCSSV